MWCNYIAKTNIHRENLRDGVHGHWNTQTDTMIILELGDVLGDNLVAIILYTILLAIDRTYLVERLGYALAIIADVSAKKVYVQCGRAANLS